MSSPARRRPRLRGKGLVADTSTVVDLAAYEPAVDLGVQGRVLLAELARETPFWWTDADLPMVGLLCAATDQVQRAIDEQASAAGMAAILKEWRSIADQLGMSPTSRSRLKLTEAQAVTAARRAEALGEPDRVAAMDVDDLLGDDDG